MLSAGEAASSTSRSWSHVQLILDAVADYARITGIVLITSPFAAAIQHANSPEGIQILLQERAKKAFKEVRDGDQRLTRTLNPAVKILHALSGNLDEAVSTVSHTCHLVSLLT